MKTSAKAFIIISIVFAIATIKSCVLFIHPHEECYNCNITDFELSMREYSTQEEVKKFDTIAYNQIVLDMNSITHLDCQETTCALNNIQIIKTTYANDAKFYITGEIASIEIYSNADYDSLHPAGTLLNDIIELFNFTLRERILLSSISFPIHAKQVLYFNINPQFPPDSLRLHEFSVIYKEVDSTVITKTFQPVYISPIKTY